MPPGQHLAVAQQWYQRLDLPAYDCHYLGLAVLRQGVLVALARRLPQKLKENPATNSLAMPLEQWRSA